MKKTLLSVCIPSYNSAPFLHYAVDSLLPFKDDVEVLIIDDGSKDDTGIIADEYQSKYPTCVKAIHQENGGHGAGINNGIIQATGSYFKVLDSDDWFDSKGLKALLDYIRNAKDNGSDIVLSPYTYVHGHNGETGKTEVFSRLFKKSLSKDWSQVPDFKVGENITIHALTVKTEILKKEEVDIPTHISYDDNCYVFVCLSRSKTISYVPVSLYQYFIGREGQSMETKTMLRKYNDLLKVASYCFDLASDNSFEEKSPKLKKVLKHNLVFMFANAAIWTRLNTTKEAKKGFKDFKANLKKQNKKIYNGITKRSYVFFLFFPGFFGKSICRLSAFIANKYMSSER
ncbi:MAG: glycosyltransferase family 2 protein [Bacilli bacterium]